MVGGTTAIISLSKPEVRGQNEDSQVSKQLHVLPLYAPCTSESKDGGLQKVQDKEYHFPSLMEVCYLK